MRTDMAEALASISDELRRIGKEELSRTLKRSGAISEADRIRLESLAKSCTERVVYCLITAIERHWKGKGRNIETQVLRKLFDLEEGNGAGRGPEASA